MEMFHGTSKQRGEAILNDRKVKINVPRVYGPNHPVLPSNPNFVYVTTGLNMALFYGKNAVEIDTTKGNVFENEIWIFKMNINEAELLADQDEIEKERLWKHDIEDIDDSDYKSSLKYTNSARIARELNLNSNEVTHYVKIPYTLESQKFISRAEVKKLSNLEVEEELKSSNIVWISV